MPIYEYRCSGCGFQKEYLQKVSDPPMSLCPSCNTETFTKMLTAAGFQLKGSGWYATDFKGGKTSKPADDAGGGAKTDDKSATKTESETKTKTETTTDAKTQTKTESGTKTATPAVT